MPTPPVAAPAPLPEPVVVEPPAEQPAEEETDKPSISIGAGVRAGISIDMEGAAADPTISPSPETTVRADQINFRPYFSGQVHENIAFEANLEVFTSSIALLDAVVKLQLHDLFNIWMGQFLGPSSRANLSGPYYQNSWNFPLFVQAFPFDISGRDRGVAVWGQVAGGVFKYQLGLMDLEPGNPVENSRFQGRLVVNLLDPEPGYYNSSTYYGAKDILAIGATVAAQDANTANDDDSMMGFQFDILFEKNFGQGGVLNLEGSFWSFDTDPGYFDSTTTVIPDILNRKGHSMFWLASWMTPDKVGVGHIQPSIRIQTDLPDGGDAEHLIDGGLNYIIDGYNARVHLIVAHNTAKEDTSIQAGTQLQMW